MTGTQKEINFRKKSVFNMWLIVGSIFLTITYIDLYSLILY